MKDHINVYASLIALAMLLGTGIWFVQTGMHEGTLLGVIITGAVAIAQGIAGIKQSLTPGTTTATVTQVPPAPADNPIQGNG